MSDHFHWILVSYHRLLISEGRLLDKMTRFLEFNPGTKEKRCYRGVAKIDSTVILDFYSVEIEFIFEKNYYRDTFDPGRILFKLLHGMELLKCSKMFHHCSAIDLLSHSCLPKRCSRKQLTSLNRLSSFI